MDIWEKTMRKKEGIQMKKIVVLIMLFGAFLLTGCSVEVDFSNSKSEEFALETENLTDEFTNTKHLLEPLKNKETLTGKDQQKVAKQLQKLNQQIENFRESKGSFLENVAKKATKKVLDDKEKVLVKMLEKAEMSQLETEDINSLIKELSDDIEIKLFK
jgi:hypothetical protein